MYRFIAVAAIAVLLLAVVLRSRNNGAGAGGGPLPGTIRLQEAPDVEVVEVEGGADLTVRHRFAGSVSRASLVYEMNGEDCTLDVTTACRKALADSKVRSDTYTSEVELGGRLPQGAEHVRLVLEAETGTKVLPVRFSR